MSKLDFCATYKENAKGCSCIGWARADYFSGFLSIHHAGCKRFDAITELHIKSGELIKLHEDHDELLRRYLK